MADGTKAVVDTAEADDAADEAALAMAIDEFAADTADEAVPVPVADDDAAGNGPDAASGSETPDGPKKAGPKKSTAAKSTATKCAPAKSAPVKGASAKSAAAKSTATKTAPQDGGPKGSVAEETAETTAPLSADEIAVELAAGAALAAATAARAAKAAPAKGPGAAAKAAAPAPADSTDPGDTGDLPRTLPAPLRHSGDMIGGRYRLEECISQTETFSSWRAVDEKLRRAVGVHLLAAGHQRARAVLAAAKSAALLGDPRFVQVLDAVQEGELVYVVREWLPDASDLAKLLATGPMEPYDAYQMVRQVTDAIATAHRRGQAHLRLTPRCVLRTEGGQYRINGIAVDAALRGLPAEEDAKADESGELADTRAIGVLLYAALTHRWPFPEDRYDLQGLPKRLGCVPPDQVRANVHKGLSELAARTLCEQPPHHSTPITTPEELAKAIALMPRIRQPEPELPAFTPPRRTPPALAPAPVSAPPPPAPTFHTPTSQLPYPPRPRRRRLRRALKATAWTVALAAVGFSSWQLVGQLRPPGTAHPSATVQPDAAHSASGKPVAVPNGKPVAITDVKSFNPLGDSPEHVEALPNTHDGNPESVWATQGYIDQFPKLKEGTGLLIDLGSPQQVSSVSVQFVGSTRAELRVPSTQSGSAPTEPGGYTSVAQESGVQTDLRPAAPVTTRYLLLWLTALPKDGDGRYRGQVSELKITG